MTEQNIVSELASFTEAGEHTKFQLLQNWQEYRFTRKVRYSLVVLTKSLLASANKQLRNYCKAVVDETANVFNLIAYMSTIRILNFYLEELKIVEDMLDEYEIYLLAGNWLDFILGLQRPLDKLRDYRED
jgi:hypothetical protein